MEPIDADSWSSLKLLAVAQVEQEPILSGHLYDLVLRHRGYPEALAYLIAATLSNQVFSLAAMDFKRRRAKSLTCAIVVGQRLAISFFFR